MNIPQYIPPATRRVLSFLMEGQERQDNTGGDQLAMGEVPSVQDPFPEYTFRWGLVREDGSGSGPPAGSGSGNSINSEGAPHAWDEIERFDDMAGEYQMKVNGIEGELPDYSKDSNDPVNLRKNTAWDLSGTQWPAGTIIFVQMVTPGEWWIIFAMEGTGGSGSGGGTHVTIDCGDGVSRTATIRGNHITVG